MPSDCIWLLPDPYEEPESADADDDTEETQADAPSRPTAAEFLRGEGVPTRAGHKGDIWLGVLPTNREAVEVFRQCKPTLVVGFGGSAWLGISAVELRCALGLVRIAKGRRDAAIAGVRVMESAYSRVVRDSKPKPSEPEARPNMQASRTAALRKPGRR